MALLFMREVEDIVNRFKLSLDAVVFAYGGRICVALDILSTEESDILAETIDPTWMESAVE